MELAANEPVYMSSSLSLERDYGWRGLCVFGLELLPKVDGLGGCLSGLLGFPGLLARKVVESHGLVRHGCVSCDPGSVAQEGWWRVFAVGESQTQREGLGARGLDGLRNVREL